MWPLGHSGGAADPEKRTFTSRMGVEPKHIVVLLGAGASADAGCPVMRGFIDRAYDFEKLGRFSKSELPDVRAALELYQSVRANFQITEEDTENIESLLSLADLSTTLIEVPSIPELRNPQLSNQLRRFIEAVVTKSVSLPGPNSAVWPGNGAAAAPYAQFIRYLAYLGSRVTVISLNYDCIIEYCCYCMGLPFTYHRSAGDGLEILKLHGSSNWVSCGNTECDQNGVYKVSEIAHNSATGSDDNGFISVVDTQCHECGERLSPLIVPPTWAKSFDSSLKSYWTRAVEAISEAEAFVSIGMSLPESDAHFRELLHVGLASAKLRHALAVVGPDRDAGERWSKLFRESWRNSRFEVRHSKFSNVLNAAVRPALVVPSGFGSNVRKTMLPTDFGMSGLDAIDSELRSPPWQNSFDTDKVSWGSVLENYRNNTVSDKQHNEVIGTLNLDWRPSGPALPIHGSRFLA